MVPCDGIRSKALGYRALGPNFRFSYFTPKSNCGLAHCYLVALKLIDVEVNRVDVFLAEVLPVELLVADVAVERFAAVMSHPVVVLK